MKRAANLLGTVLTLAGVLLLAFVAVTYIRGRQTASTPQWSAAQQRQGQHIVAELAKSKGKSHHQSRGPIPGSEPALRIVIPRIHVNAPVVETPPLGGVWQVADWAAGHLTGSAEPGAVGNDSIAAHDDIKGEIFKRLGELRPGDTIQLRTRHAIYVYEVTDQLAVDPSDTSVLLPTRLPYVTLVTCTPYWVDTQRLIVQGVLKHRIVV